GIRDFHVTGVQTCALPIFGIAVLQEVQQWFGLSLVLASQLAEAPHAMDAGQLMVLLNGGQQGWYCFTLHQFELSLLTNPHVGMLEQLYQLLRGVLAEIFCQTGAGIPALLTLAVGRFIQLPDAALAVAPPALNPVAHVERALGSKVQTGTLNATEYLFIRSKLEGGPCRFQS